MLRSCVTVMYPDNLVVAKAKTTAIAMSFYPCPNPVCTHRFPMEQVQSASSLKCPVCGQTFHFRPPANKPANRPSQVPPPLVKRAEPKPPPARTAAPLAMPVAKPVVPEAKKRPPKSPPLAQGNGDHLGAGHEEPLV